MYFNLHTAKAAAQRANEEIKGRAAHPSAYFTLAAASLGVLSILLPPDPEVAPFSLSQA